MRELVSATFLAGWEAARPAIPAVLEDDQLPAADTFVQLTITPTTSSQQTAGRRATRRVERQGWAVVKMWVPALSGAASVAADLVGTVRAILELVDLPSPIAGDDSLSTAASNQQSVGTDGRWYMLLVRTPFTYTSHV